MVVEPIQEVYSYVLESVFGCYLKTPAALQTRLAAIRTPVAITGEGLEFTLPALYDLAIAQMSPRQSVMVQSYSSFRHSLYGQHTQAQLGVWGGEVIIADNQQQVDQSTYRLQALTKKGS